MNCKEVFNVASDGLRQVWTPSLVGLALVVVGAIVVAVMYRSERAWFAWLLLAVTVVLTIAAAGFPLSTYFAYRRALSEGTFETVEGRVEQFTAMPAGGHAPERFTIRGEHFSYTDYSASPSFHQTQIDGGPIREGVYLKIAHVHGVIIRLEVCGP